MNNVLLFRSEAKYISLHNAHVRGKYICLPLWLVTKSIKSHLNRYLPGFSAHFLLCYHFVSTRAAQPLPLVLIGSHQILINPVHTACLLLDISPVPSSIYTVLSAWPIIQLILLINPKYCNEYCSVGACWFIGS